MTAEHGGAERGSGTVLGVAVIGGVLALIMVLAPVYAAFLTRQRVASAADLVALAAADAARGIIPGVPCEVAAAVASANRVDLAGCRLDGPIATIRVVTGFAGLPVEAVSTAGPPGAADEISQSR